MSSNADVASDPAIRLGRSLGNARAETFAPSNYNSYYGSADLSFARETPKLFRFGAPEAH
jgi:hypothetical protein